MTTAGGPAGGDLRGRSPSAGAPPLPSTGLLRRRPHSFRHLVLLTVVWLIAGIGPDSWSTWPLFVLVGRGALLGVHGWWASGGPSRAGSAP